MLAFAPPRMRESIDLMHGSQDEDTSAADAAASDIVAEGDRKLEQYPRLPHRGGHRLDELRSTTQLIAIEPASSEIEAHRTC